MTVFPHAAALVLIGMIVFSARPGGDGQGAPPATGSGAGTLPPDIHPDSLARLPKVNRADLDAEGRRVYDHLVSPASRYRDGLWGPVGMWMHSPPMAEHMFAASTYLRYGTQFDQRTTELAILVTARELNAQFEWTSHEPSALRAGLEPAIVDIVKRRKSTGGLAANDAIVIEFGRELIGRHQLSSATFAKALAAFGRQGVTNLAALMAYYSFNKTIIDAFDVHLRADQKPLLP
jgi:4-carboxymuconolactone decarboxylase